MIPIGMGNVGRAGRDSSLEDLSIAPSAGIHEALDALVFRAAAAVRMVAPEDLAPMEPPPTVATEELTAKDEGRDELRRLTIMFCDLVGSTSLSGRLDLETYRAVVGAYKHACQAAIEEQFDGHVMQTRGDGILAVFGYPTAHEDDVLRAVKAGLAIHEALEDLPTAVRNGAGGAITARVGIHRGLVFLEHGTDELYGLAVNVAARVHDATEPGTIAISDEVRDLVSHSVITRSLGPRELKGVDHALELHVVIGEHASEVMGGQGWASRLIGRDDEVAELLTRWTETIAGIRSDPITVVGEAGVGKSRLVEAFVERVGEQASVLRLGGSPFRQRQGLAAVRQLLCVRADVRRDRPASEQLSTLRRWLVANGLPDLLPLLAPVAGISSEAGYEPEAVEPRLLEARIGDAVHRLALHLLSGGPSLVVIEDLHWLDDATRAVINRLVWEGPTDSLMVATSRDDADTVGEPSMVIRLGPLKPDDCIALIRLHGEVSDQAIADIAARSDGIPLFVEELVRAQQDGMLEGSASGGIEVESVPPSLYEPLSARLSALGSTRVVASAAATIGRTVDLELLSQVSEVSADELDHAVTALIEKRVFEPGQDDGRIVRFRHELVRRVAYSVEPVSGRRRFHALAARSMALGLGSAGSDWSRIGEHHRRSGESVAAALAFQAAADDARQRGSLAECRSNLDLAVACIADAEPAAERNRIEVRLLLARSFIVVSSEGFGSQRAAEDYLRSLELSVEQPAGIELYRTLLAMWGYYINRSDLDRAELLNDVLRPLCAGDRLHLLPTNEAGYGIIQFYRGRFERSDAHLTDAVRNLGQVGRAGNVPDAWSMALDPVSSVHAHCGLTRGWLGDIERARSEMDIARQRCADLPFPFGPFSLGYVGLLETTLDLHLGDVAAAGPHVDEVLDVSVRHGLDPWALWGSIFQAMLGAMSGAGAAARQQAEAAAMGIELFDAVGARVHSARLYAGVANVHLDLGDRARALATADLALRVINDTGATAVLGDALRVRALAGAPANVETDLMEALSTADSQGSVVTAVRIATDLARVDLECHRGALVRALARVPSSSDAPVLAIARRMLEGA